MPIPDYVLKVFFERLANHEIANYQSDPSGYPVVRLGGSRVIDTADRHRLWLFDPTSTPASQPHLMQFHSNNATPIEADYEKSAGSGRYHAGSGTNTFPQGSRAAFNLGVLGIRGAVSNGDMVALKATYQVMKAKLDWVGTHCAIHVVEFLGLNARTQMDLLITTYNLAHPNNFWNDLVEFVEHDAAIGTQRNLDLALLYSTAYANTLNPGNLRTLSVHSDY